MLKKYGVWLALGLWIPGALFWLWQSNDTDLAVDLEKAKQVNQLRYESPVIQGETIALPDSLKGVSFQPQFEVNEGAHLIPDYALRELFEHYLSLYGEIDLEQIIKLIQAEIINALTEPAKSEAIDLLKRYIDYKIALAEDQSIMELNSQTELSYLEKTVAANQALKSLRERFFSLDEYEAFFSREDQQNDVMLAQMRIHEDKSLTKEERVQQLKAAEMRLPESIRESRKQVQQHVELREQVTILRQQGASETEIYQLREQELGTEAAQALADLDEQRKQWQARLEQFAEERKLILGSSLSETDKANSVNDLLLAQFDETERKRVSALVNDGRLN